MSKSWFITGASRGLGRIWAEAALARGDQVAATGLDWEDLARIKELYGDAVLPMRLDVTNPGQVWSAVNAAHAHFGRLDIVLNNAGYSLVGAVEELNEAEVRAEFDVNVFGALRVIQAALPLLRAQGGGHIMGVTSGFGLVAAPLLGAYCASKWALEALHDSLAQEVGDFGIKVTMLEPGAYATGFASPQSLRISESLAAYSSLRSRVHKQLSTEDRGDPLATAAVILAIADAEDPPLRFVVGSKMLPIARAAYAERLATWDAWESLSNAAQGEPTDGPPIASF